MLDRIGHLIKRPGLPDPSYRFLLEAEPADEAVSLDCETTGFDPRVDEVVSIAAIRIAGRRILASSAFRALVRPEGAMRPDSIKVHRLRQQDVAQAQPMSEVLLLYFIGSRPLVGYWIQFDVRMLDEYLLAMIDMRLPSREIDVSRLLRSQIREHAARHVRRFALCRHSRRSETAHAGATRCLRGRRRRGRNVSCGSRTCGSAACGCRVRGPIFQAPSRTPERHRHAVGASLSRMAHRGFCGLSIEDKIPTTRRSRALAMS